MVLLSVLQSKSYLWSNSPLQRSSKHANVGILNFISLNFVWNQKNMKGVIKNPHHDRFRIYFQGSLSEVIFKLSQFFRSRFLNLNVFKRFMVAKFLKTRGPFPCKTNTLIGPTTLSYAIFPGRQSGQEITIYMGVGCQITLFQR